MSGDEDRWFVRHHRELRERLNDPRRPYPCHFGTQADGRGDNWYEWLEFAAGRPAAGIRRLAARLAEFVQASRSADPGRRLTLLCAVGPPGLTGDLDQDRALFWRVLAELRDIDHVPPPPTVPTDPDDSDDPDDPGWSFSHAGEAMFVFGLSPFYGRRNSRRLGRCLTICFQSTRVFAGISGATAAGVKSKATIRDRLAGYDDVPLIEALGDGNSSTTDKWRQYFPAEDGRLDSGRCPLREVRDDRR